MSYIDDILKSVGDETAVLKKVNKSSINKWGDAAEEDVETVQIKAVFEVVSGEIEEVAEGDFRQGDLRAFVPEYTDGMDEGNILEYQGTEYEIVEVVKKSIGNQQHFEVRAGQT